MLKAIYEMCLGLFPPYETRHTCIAVMCNHVNIFDCNINWRCDMALSPLLPWVRLEIQCIPPPPLSRNNLLNLDYRPELMIGNMYRDIPYRVIFPNDKAYRDTRHLTYEAAGWLRFFTSRLGTISMGLMSVWNKSLLTSDFNKYICVQSYQFKTIAEKITMSYN